MYWGPQPTSPDVSKTGTLPKAGVTVHELLLLPANMKFSAFAVSTMAIAATAAKTFHLS